MGAQRKTRRTRLLFATAAIAATVAIGTACEPTAGGLDSAAIALTTDQTGTRALERTGLKVQWMSCTSQTGERSPAKTQGASNSPVRNIATVDCQGETTDNRKITLKGRVTEERNGRCVRGNLTARVAGSTVFQANVLGNCGAPPSTGRPTATQTEEPEEPGTPRPTVTQTVQPPTPTQEPTTHPPNTPPVTVTVTASPDPPPETPTPDPPPTCDCEDDAKRAGHS